MMVPMSRGMWYLVCNRAKPVRRSSPILVLMYVFKRRWTLTLLSHSQFVTGRVHMIRKRQLMFGNICASAWASATEGVLSSWLVYPSISASKLQIPHEACMVGLGKLSPYVAKNTLNVDTLLGFLCSQHKWHSSHCRHSFLLYARETFM